jgi:hypothetical protein
MVVIMKQVQLMVDVRYKNYYFNDPVSDSRLIIDIEVKRAVKQERPM